MMPFNKIGSGDIDRNLFLCYKYHQFVDIVVNDGEDEGSNPSSSTKSAYTSVCFLWG